VHNSGIINLIEVENLRALGTLNTKFLAGRGYVAYLVNETGTATGHLPMTVFRRR